MLVAEKRDLAATWRFVARTREYGPRPGEVSTERAPVYPRVLDELVPFACHIVEQDATNPIEADHGLLKARLGPMCGLPRLCSMRVIGVGQALLQNFRRGHDVLGVDVDLRHRILAVFTECAHAI